MPGRLNVFQFGIHNIAFSFCRMFFRSFIRLLNFLSFSVSVSHYRYMNLSLCFEACFYLLQAIYYPNNYRSEYLLLSMRDTIFIS